MSRLGPTFAVYWNQYGDHVTKNLERLKDDPLRRRKFISEMGDYFVLQKYPYQVIQQLMDHINGLDQKIQRAVISQPAGSSQIPSTRGPRLPLESGGVGSTPSQTQSLPNSPRQTQTDPTVLSAPSSPRQVPTLPTESTRVLVEFESPSEWYRALEMIRSVEAHRAKMRASGGKSRKPPIEARLL